MGYYRGPLPRPKKEGPRINEQIKVSKVKLVDENGRLVGIVSIQEALRRAEEAGLDLVEVAPNQFPPVCRIMDYGKYKYQKGKKEKKSTAIKVKELKFSPQIEDHDFEVKLRKAREFLEEGNKVRIVVRFRGRQAIHMDDGRKVLEQFIDALSDIAKVEHPPAIESYRNMVAVVAPKSKKK
ncbi:translation initiation factor IF-3 [candidate division WOR-3 bacterium]|nr:translation initiation factor IF-3 [candidate division WOR-3 bacterium]